MFSYENTKEMVTMMMDGTGMKRSPVLRVHGRGSLEVEAEPCIVKDGLTFPQFSLVTKCGIFPLLKKGKAF